MQKSHNGRFKKTSNVVTNTPFRLQMYRHMVIISWSFFIIRCIVKLKVINAELNHSIVTIKVSPNRIQNVSTRASKGYAYSRGNSYEPYLI